MPHYSVETDHNMVDSEDYDEYKLKKKHAMLKSKHKDLKSNFQKLQDLASDPELATEDFSDLRVYQLWSMAKKSNMSHTELNSLRVNFGSLSCIIYLDNFL